MTTDDRYSDDPLERGAFRAGGCQPGICQVEYVRSAVSPLRSATFLHRMHGVERILTIDVPEDGHADGDAIDRAAEAFEAAIKEYFPTYHIEIEAS